MTEVTDFISDDYVHTFGLLPDDNNNDTFLHAPPFSPVQVLIERATRVARHLPDTRLCFWTKPFNMSRYIVSFGDEGINEVYRSGNESRSTNYVTNIIDRIYDALPPTKTDWSDDILDTLACLDRYVEEMEYQEPHTFAESRSQAKHFFERFSTLLPKKPFVYPTTKGELLAEISNEQWSITIIFNKRDMIVFSSTQAGKRFRFVEDWQHAPSRMVEVLEQELASREG